LITPTTSESEWLGALRFAPRWQPELKRTVVMAPHPDDEVLGAGGLIADRRRKNLPVLVIAVTDGEAAYPGTSGLGSLRQTEQEEALARLGLASRDILRLGLPDGHVSSHEESLVRDLQSILTRDTVLIAPWKFDPHPDHEACGRAALRAAQISGQRLVSYVFWTWHRHRADALLAFHPQRFDLDPGLCAAKASALAEYRSQLAWETGEPILPDFLLAPARRTFETFIIHGHGYQL
jgi:LmbE family N-acetylglucosaminyl deacetylase